MPHHKGRKRMHIELKEGLSKVGEDVLKVGGDMIKNAWSFVDDTQAFLKRLLYFTFFFILSRGYFFDFSGTYAGGEEGQKLSKKI